MTKARMIIILLIVLLVNTDSFSQPPIQHYIFFNVDRVRIQEATFLNNNQIKGAQLKYTWPELAGINLPESAVGFGSKGMHPSGFTFEKYRDL